MGGSSVYGGIQRKDAKMQRSEREERESCKIGCGCTVAWTSVYAVSPRYFSVLTGNALPTVVGKEFSPACWAQPKRGDA